MDKIDRDLIGFSTREGYVGIVFFIYRQGKLLSKRKFVYEIIGDLNEFVGNIILQYYANNIIPKEIDVFNKELKDYEVIYNDIMSNDYTFTIKSENSSFYSLFNYLSMINRSSYYFKTKYRKYLVLFDHFEV